MNVFFETACDDLFIALYDQKYQLLGFKHHLKLVQKVEKIPTEFEALLKEHDIKISQIKNIYINLGPGTFTGSRISLVFARTLCQLNSIQLHTTNTFLLASISNKKVSKINIDARGGKMFQAQVVNGKMNSKIEILNKTIIHNLDYELLANHFINFLPIFELEKDLLAIEPLYIKRPQIGGV